MAVGCAEMRKHHKIWSFYHPSETDDSPDTLIFYFRHNIFMENQRKGMSYDK